MKTELRKKMTKLIKPLNDEEREVLFEILKDGRNTPALPIRTQPYLGQGVQRSEINYEGHGW